MNENRRTAIYSAGECNYNAVTVALLIDKLVINIYGLSSADVSCVCMSDCKHYRYIDGPRHCAELLQRDD